MSSLENVLLHGRFSILELLIGNGDSTALHFAVYGCNEDSLKMLRKILKPEHRLKVNTVDSDGKSVLHATVLNWKASNKILEHLQPQHGLHVKAIDSDGRTVLDYVIKDEHDASITVAIKEIMDAQDAREFEASLRHDGARDLAEFSDQV